MASKDAKKQGMIATLKQIYHEEGTAGLYGGEFMSGGSRWFGDARLY